MAPDADAARPLDAEAVRPDEGASGFPDAQVPTADADPTREPDVGSPPDAAPPAPPSWAPCAVLAGQPDPRVECLEVEVPLRRGAPEAGEITLFVKRLVPDAPDGRSVWMLAGGPGQAGDAFEGYAARLAADEPGLTIYMPDHRGTGNSTRLGCPVAEGAASAAGATITDDEWAACHAQLAESFGGAENLAGFSTTEAARDLEFLIRLTGEARPFILGVSYGTFLAYRFLQIAPEGAAGVVFDSACMPGYCRLSQQDIWEDGVGRAFFDEVCGEDETCREKLGPRPTEAVAALHQALQDGHCPLLGEPEQARNTLRAVLAQMLIVAAWRPALPAFVYRFQRCSAADQMALVAMFENLFGPGGGGGQSSYSLPLGVNILFSEMWEVDEPSAEVLGARYEGTLMCRGVANLLAPAYPVWSRYEEPLLSSPVDSEVPTLILQGEYDPLTPVHAAEPMAEALSGPNQRFVVVPNASHTVTQQSAMAENTAENCGTLLLRAFMDDPRGPLPDCGPQTLKPNFAGSPAYNQAIFETDDLWEN